MRSRQLFPLVVLLFLLLALPVSHSQASSSAQPRLGLGYGPSSIEPASVGIPIYAAGDQLWVQSYETSDSLTISLNSPMGTVTGPTTLEPGGLFNLYTFSPQDPTGQWTVAIFDFNTEAVSSANIIFDKAPPELAPTPAGTNTTGNSVNLLYTLPSTSAYGIQGCTMGTSTGPSSSFRLPASPGGTIQFSLNGTTASISTQSITEPLTAWFDLYTTRTYLNGTALLSEDTLAAQTNVLQIGGQSNTVVAKMTTELNLRVGRYDLRSYVRTSSGLIPFDTPYLRTNATGWVSLNQCTELTDVNSNSFVMASDLDNSNSTWPRLLYTLYTSGGIDGFTVTKINAAEARIDLVTAINFHRLAGEGAVVTGSGLQVWDTFNGSIYLLGDRFPLSLSVNVTFDGVTSESFNISVSQPYSSVQLPIPTGGIAIHTSSSGAPLANVTVDISLPGSNPAQFKTNNQGNLAITLPPGAYDVTSSYAGYSVSQTIQVISGEVTDVTLELRPPAYPVVLIILGTVLVAGVGLNFLVWRAYANRRRAFR